LSLCSVFFPSLQRGEVKKEEEEDEGRENARGANGTGEAGQE
jgi:hypothetical protein